jgi:hypothetical protein
MSARIGTKTILLCTAFLAAVGLASSASALVITGGPTYTLPGGGTCTVSSGVPSVGTGATVSCTGVNLAAHSNVYIGIKNDTNVNGLALDGGGPSGGEIFGFSSAGANSITYTSSGSITSLITEPALGTDTTTNTLTITRTAGSATVVSTGGTPASNGNGAIERLFRLTSGSSFTFDVDITSSNPNFSGQACSGVYDSTHVTTGAGLTCLGRVDLAFYYSDCGDGVVDSPEACDLGASNGLSTSCCTSACAFRGAGLICRTAAGVCDLNDTCSGSSATCPTDAKSTAVCRASAGTCDLTENCNGAGNNCPADAKSTAVCRASGGVCDVTETCDGVADTCPTDTKSTAVCRASGGTCDVVESCDGATDDCPSDDVLPSSTECRASGGVCDLAENCTGSGPVCPGDGKSTAECRASAGACDIAEACDGAANDCPGNAKSTAECRASAGGCDIAEACDGAADDCPTDTLVSDGTVCRGSAGTCDVAEECDGASAACPGDGVALSTVVCRGAAGLCDIADQCDGVGVACPADVLEPSTTVCRAATGGEVCDVEELCTGSSAACPADLSLPDGTSCEDGNFCNGSQTCSSGVCSGGTDPCAVDESCDEATELCFTGSCPVNAVACRAGLKHKVLIKNKADNAKDKLIWKWGKGALTTTAEFGDPTTTADYALCFYAGPGADLLQGLGVPANATKWAALGTKGYKYNDPAGAEAGITKIIVKGGAFGKSKALVKGKGLGLPDFDSDLPIATGDLPLIVQLRNNDNGICWESEFITAKKNGLDQFNAKRP